MIFNYFHRRKKIREEKMFPNRIRGMDCFINPKQEISSNSILCAHTSREETERENNNGNKFGSHLIPTIFIRNV